MKEAPKDHLSCEATMLHESTLIQGGCDLVVVEEQSLSLVAINATFHQDLGGPLFLSDMVSQSDCEQLRLDIQSRHNLSPRIVTFQDGTQTWIRPYRFQKLIGIEFSPRDEMLNIDENSNHAFATVVKELSQRHEMSMEGNSAALDDYFEKLTSGIQMLTGFDRVMVYKFDADRNGEVIAEAAHEGVDRFLGLKFPSGDIPRPAREMFARNKIRQIIDVDCEPDQMINPADRTPYVFDQTDTSFRYASPIHIDYLRNMGVTATLTLAIEVAGRLWGLLSCHHTSGPHRISLSELSLCHVLSDLSSNHVARQEEWQRNQLSSKINSLLSDISVATITASSEEDLANVVLGYESRVLSLLKADGLQFESETANWIIGDVPGVENMFYIDQLAHDWLRDTGRGFFATSDLAGFLKTSGNACAVTGGLIFSHSWDSKTRIKVFRKAKPLQESWAGDPNAKAKYTLENPRIMHPRNSFEAYKTTAKDRSENWRPEEISAVEVLQTGLRNIEMTFHKSFRERQLRHSNAEMRNALIRADFQANHDPLTGLMNRRGLEAFVAGLVQRSNRNDGIWFCHIDLDHFKEINDQLGHNAGDLMLKRVAEVLDKSQSKGSKAARIGGDEFALLLAGNLSKAAARDICTEVIKTITEPIEFEGAALGCGCTIGATKFTPGQADIKILLKESDLALYHGKFIGRGRVVFFSQDMQDASSRRRSLEADLLRGIAAQEFIPYFQPQFDCCSEKIVGFEALSRWRHPEKGVLPPSEFLTLATQLGVLGEIDKQIFEKAIAYQNEWFDRNNELVRLSVNISVDRLCSPDLVTDLEKLGVRSSHISLELLETIYLDDPDAEYEGVLARLRATGVSIEIDDFGTGQTSILAVVSVKPDRLKIDKRLIDPIVNDAAARGLVKAILDIGGQLGIQVIAEGVETRDQLKILQSLKCDRVQGYLFSKPLAPISIEADYLTAA